MFIAQQKHKTHCNFDCANKSESIYKNFDKNYIKSQQIKIKLYTTITDLKFSMSFINLFIGLLVQWFLVFSSKEVLLHITIHNFGHLRLPFSVALFRVL